MRLYLSCVLLALASTARAEGPGVELVDEAKELTIVGACAEGTPTHVKAETIAAYCKDIRQVQDDYRKKWISEAVPFFNEHVPKDIPKQVVYPFAGGDLSSALAVFPDADEITTLALEPAGDARALTHLKDSQVKAALGVVSKELHLLYRLNYSHTMDMIGSMRGAELPTQLIFTLTAFHLHGYEVTSMKYFNLTEKGEVHYLTKDELDAAEALKDASKRNAKLADIEIRYRKPGGKREQVYRHVVANLDDPHLAKDPSALRYLEAKGHVSAMTKAASFLLNFTEFKTMRKYIIDHVDWMVSDATGLSPKDGKPVGFEYETYGTFERSEMDPGAPFSPVWAAEFKAQPKRDLKFRFGYPDIKFRNHLIIMRRGKKTAPN
jgi:hypothetical protein